MTVVLSLSLFTAVAAVAITTSGVPIASAVGDAAFIGETPYETLAAAVAAANAMSEDTTIKLGADIAEAIVVKNTTGKTITLDLNGYVLSAVKTNNLIIKTPFVITDSKIDDGTGKYICSYENTIYNTGADGNNGIVLVEDIVIENTCTYCNTAKIIYWPSANATFTVRGEKTKIIYDSEYCSLTNNPSSLFITGGTFNVDPSGVINAAQYMVNTVTQADGTMLYTVVERPPAYYWLDERDENGLTVDEAGTTYTVTTPEGLAQLAYLVNNGNSFRNKTVVLGADIDLGKAYTYWTPIGTYAKPFEGTFDGAGHKISNMTILGGFEQTGLFGVVSSLPESGYRPLVKNLTIENADVNGSFYTAVAIGLLYVADAENITVTGDVRVLGARYSGIIVGQGYCNITSCKVDVNEGSVLDGGNGKNGYFIGGIIGHWGHGAMTDCHVKGLEIRADWGVGGLVGLAISDGSTRTSVTYSSCENVIFTSTKVYGDTYFGGLCGTCKNIDLEKSYVKNIELPDTTSNIGFITGEAEEVCTAVDVCYINVITNNQNIGQGAAFIDGQAQATARSSADNPYGVGYYVGSAGTGEEDNGLPFDQIVVNAETDDEIVISGYVDEFLVEPVTVGKRITVNFGTYYNPAVTYIVPEEGYSVEVAEDESGNTILTVEEIEYTATFVDRLGNTVGTDTFNVADMTVTEPEVPAYGGFLAAWEEYELTLADITIHPVYNENVFLTSTDLVDCTFDGAATANRGETYTGTLAPVSADYNIPFSVSVEVGGAALTAADYTYNMHTGVLSINASAVTGAIHVSATARPATESIVIWTQYAEQSYYIVDGEGDVYNSKTSEYATGMDVNFRVVLFSAYDKSAITVFCNGTPLTANADGSYTISEVGGANVITVSGITVNPTPQTAAVLKDISFLEKLLMLIADFFNKIRAIFGL